jgi:hypothetical protein
MQWFEDIVHFQGSLGALMLAAVRDHQVQGDWYEVVDSNNIEKHLDAMRRDKDTYKKNRIEQVPKPITRNERDNDAL